MKAMRYLRQCSRPCSTTKRRTSAIAPYSASEAVGKMCLLIRLCRALVSKGQALRGRPSPCLPARDFSSQNVVKGAGNASVPPFRLSGGGLALGQKLLPGKRMRDDRVEV